MIELNGIANIKILLDHAKSENSISEDLYLKLYSQADLLERYMIKIDETMPQIELNLENSAIPFWHELKQNLAKYPNIKEKNNL